MTKFKLQDLKTILNSDVLKDNSCIEIEFSIDDDSEYDDCWLGKMPDRDESNKEIYWYGLAPDGSQAYEYTELKDILNAKVFHGKSLYVLIDKINWHSLDGCSIEERLPYYIDQV
ncbi:hypothetical protein ACPWSR_07530 [Alloiococcus sp. CFN-8]|uniref:hypothetical protein n=1 Tax=Alloiococcus sp. CFN-8 TaxID=3416081 RepID=UPI003CEAE6B5